MAGSSKTRLAPEERLKRLLSWCQFPEAPTEWDHDAAERCRQLLPQIASAAMDVGKLPPMFHVPLSRYLNNDPTIVEVIDDDDRLLLMMSDMRDYVSLMLRGYL